MKEIVQAIHQNGKFKENKIIKPYLTDNLGIRILFPEGAQCILWFNGKNYYARCEAFGALFTLNIPRNIGKELFDRFKEEYDGNYTYEAI
jgi:hypothetical protein